MKWFWGSLLLMLVVDVQAALPYPITITTCRGYTVSKRGDGTLFVRCPGQPFDKPLFTIAAGCCMNPVITKRELSVTFDCR